MIDSTSATWYELKLYLEKELNNLQTSLEDPSADIAKTQYIRGQISALRDVVGLPYKKQSSISSPS